MSYLGVSGAARLTRSYQWGPEISNDSELRHRAHFQAWALAETEKHEEGDNPKYWTLDSLMKLNGACSRSHPPIQSLFDANEN